MTLTQIFAFASGGPCALVADKSYLLAVGDGDIFAFSSSKLILSVLLLFILKDSPSCVWCEIIKRKLLRRIQADLPCTSFTYLKHTFQLHVLLDLSHTEWASLLNMSSIVCVGTYAKCASNSLKYKQSVIKLCERIGTATDRDHPARTVS